MSIKEDNYNVLPKGQQEYTSKGVTGMPPKGPNRMSLKKNKKVNLNVPQKGQLECPANWNIPQFPPRGHLE